ncbi:AbrB family transcriptional regulator [Paenibacillus sp. HJGM_3]|uniref:AbrB/MazE/SpoVT family DNA-binding domain-containing protein n=1 Tax=Paenibacillus sp. HJGM_3 TaxID=3379816 RepID=UPI00386CEFD9
MERRVTKFGNSLGLMLTEAFKQIGLGLGDTVIVDVHKETGEIIIKKVTKMTPPTRISPDFMDTLTQVMEQYDSTIKGLKDR